MAQTLFDKLWNAHVVRDLGDGWALITSIAICCTTSPGRPVWPGWPSAASRGTTVA